MMVYYYDYGHCPLCPKTILEESTTSRHLLEHITELRAELAAKETELSRAWSAVKGANDAADTLQAALNACDEALRQIANLEIGHGLMRAKYLASNALSSPTPAEQRPDEGELQQHYWDKLADAIAAAVAEEREACAQVAESFRIGGNRPVRQRSMHALDIAAAIRARQGGQ